MVCWLLNSGPHLGAQSAYEYDWLGGAPGFSGKIFLDAPSSAFAPDGGTPADVLPGSYLTTPLGNFPIFEGSAAFYGGRGSLQWNQAQILVMFVFFDPTTPINYPDYNAASTALAVENSGITGGGV